jgi:hypothetical protein
MSKHLIAMEILIISTTMLAASAQFIPADSPKLEYSDYAELAFVPNPTKAGGKLARMQRPLNSPRKGYNCDNPGARLRIRTDAKEITVHLLYNALHVSTSARKPAGVYFIDGKASAQWAFTTSSRTTVRPVENVDVKLATPADGQAHDYDIIMPYGDSVDVAGVSVPENAVFARPAPRPKFRCAIYGDSVTQGFTADSIAGTYPKLLRFAWLFFIFYFF